MAKSRQGGRAFLGMMQQTMQSFAAQWTRGNIDGLMDLVGADPTYRTSGGAVFEGRENVRKGFAQICKPSPEGNPAAAPPVLHFFDNKCISYWVLVLPSVEGAPKTVEGVDIITFDDTGKISCKDAYRKLS